MNDIKFWAIALTSTCVLNTLSACFPVSAKPKVADDSYFHAAPGDWGFVVKNNRYYWPGMGEPDSPSRPTSELKQVNNGVILMGTNYFCSLTSLKKLRQKTPAKIAFCTKNGWQSHRGK